jgi:ribosomal protein S18
LQTKKRFFIFSRDKNFLLKKKKDCSQTFQKRKILFMTNQPLSNFSIQKNEKNEPGQVSSTFSNPGIRRSSQSVDQSNFGKSTKNSKRKVFSVSQILARVNQKKQRKFDQKKRKKPLKPIIPPKSFLLLFQEKPEKYVYNRRIIDYKHCGLLQRYIGLGGKILPRRQTRLTAKQQRYVAKTIKSARIMGLLPFVTKERGFFPKKSKFFI